MAQQLKLSYCRVIRDFWIFWPLSGVNRPTSILRADRASGRIAEANFCHWMSLLGRLRLLGLVGCSRSAEMPPDVFDQMLRPSTSRAEWPAGHGSIKAAADRLQIIEKVRKRTVDYCAAKDVAGRFGSVAALRTRNANVSIQPHAEVRRNLAMQGLLAVSKVPIAVSQRRFKRLEIAIGEPSSMTPNAAAAERAARISARDECPVHLASSRAQYPA